MNTAILVTGNLRTFDQTRQNFIDTFSFLNPDVYFVTSRNRYDYHPYIRDNVVRDSTDYEMSDTDILEIIGNIPNLACVALRPALPEDFISNNIAVNFQQHTSTVLQYFGLNVALQYLLASQKKYDTIIRTRPDLVYFPISHENIGNEDTVTVDSQNVFPNDVFFSSSAANMVNIINFMRQEMQTQSIHDSHLNPPHGLLRAAVETASSAKFSRQRIVSHVLRKNGPQYY